MSVDPNVRANVAKVRRRLADRIEALDPEQWEAPSRAAGWRAQFRT